MCPRRNTCLTETTISTQDSTMFTKQLATIFLLKDLSPIGFCQKWIVFINLTTKTANEIRYSGMNRLLFI